jgi:nitrogen-specific signal transduction histidine kinase
LLESLAITGRENPQDIPLDKFIYDLFKTFNSSFKKIRIQCLSYIEKRLTLYMRESELKQIIVNLVWNSLQAFKNQEDKKMTEALVDKQTYEDCGRRRIVLKAYQANQAIIIDVIDNAGGVRDELQGKLFAGSQPIASCEDNAKGMGLYLAFNLIKKNTGQLEYVPEREGSCFRLTFLKNPRQPDF